MPDDTVTVIESWLRLGGKIELWPRPLKDPDLWDAQLVGGPLLRITVDHWMVIAKWWSQYSALIDIRPR